MQHVAGRLAILSMSSQDASDMMAREIKKDTKLPARSLDDGIMRQPPRNQEEWQRCTQANLQRVDLLTRNVFERVNANSAAEQAARDKVTEHAKLEKQKQHKKVHTQVKVHQEFIGKAYKCMKEIEHCQSQVNGAIVKLTAERYARFAETKVCEHRLQLRTKRPGPELYRDDAQRLLEKQLSVLNSRREELLKQEDMGKLYLQHLQEAYDGLGKDIGNRRLAMRHDISTIAEGEGALYKSEDIDDKRSDAICEKAYKVGAIGLTFCHGSDELIKTIKIDSKAIAKQVDTLFGLHTKELAKMKASLAAQIVESEGAIDKAQVQLKHMEQRVEVGSPMQEAITSMKTLLRDLQANRRNAIEDLRNKTAVLDIDNSCRKVTAQMASGEALVPKTLPDSPSAPALQSSKMKKLGQNAQNGRGNSSSWHGNPQQGDGVEMSQSLSKSASSPNYHTGAGGSSSLKAAAKASVQGNNHGLYGF